LLRFLHSVFCVTDAVCSTSLPARFPMCTLTEHTVGGTSVCGRSNLPKHVITGEVDQDRPRLRLDQGRLRLDQDLVDFSDHQDRLS
jgi:hypothetical protein